MCRPKLRKEKSDGINKETLFAIMSRLSIQQRAILSLKFFEDMNLRQVSYILDMGYFRLLLYLLVAKIKLKLLLIMNGYRVIPLKRLKAVFGELTNVQILPSSITQMGTRE